MRTQIGKWGNSLALRFPKDVAEKMRVGKGTQVDLEVGEGVLRTVASRPRYSLDELIGGIRRKNIPDEIFDDGAKGRESI